MKIEDQLTPHLLSRELSHWGFPQDTAFAWSPEGRLVKKREIFTAQFDGGTWTNYECAAPTATELGLWLPELAHSYRTGSADWVAQTAGTGGRLSRGASEAEARALLLLDLVRFEGFNPESLSGGSR